MKLISSKYIVILLAAFFINIKSQAQDNGYKVNMEMAPDEKGDVAISIIIKYNASMWEQVKQNHGTDAPVVKNMWKRQFPKYEIADFSLTPVDVDRTTISKFKILGMLKLDENGKWSAELDSKDPNITKVTDNQFLLVDPTGQTLKINLPSSASNAKIEPDSFGKAILTYTAPSAGGGIVGNIIKYLGILVAAGGAFLFFKNRGTLNAVFVKDAANKKINFNQPKKIDDGGAAVVINTTPVKEQVITNNNGIDNSHE